MDFYANLHLHSTYSDATLSPEELARRVRREGYRAASLTDHDTAAGCLPFAEACAKEHLECIQGTEFSAGGPVNFHIIAFEYDPEYPPMKSYLEKMGEKETKQTREVFRMAVENGGISGITWEEVERFNEGVPWICNTHVFEAMKAKNLVRQADYMAWFDQNFRAQRGMVESEIQFLDPPDLIDLIHGAGGLAVLAHPHRQLGYVEELVACGLDGMEAWHPDLTREERREAYALALKKDLYISGGSDHCGFCSGNYDSFPTERALRESEVYLEPLSVGTTREFFEEIRDRKKKMPRPVA